MKTFSFLILIAVSAVSVANGSGPNSNGADLPAWTKEAGARKTPKAGRVCSANHHGARADLAFNSGPSIQEAIDECSGKGGGHVTLSPGEYVSGALFVKSNVELNISTGVTILGSQIEADYPKAPTRIAGIEMSWPSALINVNDAKNVKITGGGTIDGRGQLWWDKYWGLRREYEPKGLRWASDYDAERVRLMVVSRSSDVTIEDLSLKRSGFWTVQILYSDHVTIDGIKISDNAGPSTDGVDVDSSSYVLIQNCDIDNNDDDICLKAGRDFDGLRVNRPTEYVLIRNNFIRRGGGVVAFGSETSGGIRRVVAIDNRADGTKEGIRFKSAKTRGGYIEDILIRGMKMENVPLPITFTLNWNPSYSYATIPEGISNVPDYWKVMNTPVLPVERGYCLIRNIRIENIEIAAANRIFTATGLPDKTLQDVAFDNVTASGKESGHIEFAENWRMKNVILTTDSGEPVKISNSTNVDAPKVIKR